MPNMATAPYNFVSLPQEPLLAPLAQKAGATGKALSDPEKQRLYAEYVEAQGKNIGWLELDIETLTPCFSGMAATGSASGSKAREFFHVGGKHLIAGSSLRGMTKNLFKIVTAGAMRSGDDIEDRHLYFRAVAGKNHLRPLKNYYDRLLDKRDMRNPGPHPGYLLRQSTGSYAIAPAAYMRKIRTNEGKYLNGPSVYWKTLNESNRTVHVAECVSGYIGRKCHYVRIGAPEKEPGKWLPVPPDVIRDYAMDCQRADGHDLLDFKDAKRDKAAADFMGQPGIVYAVPCFYTVRSGSVRNFGQCLNYRVPYEHSIGDFVPPKHREIPVDFADAVFGSKSLWAGRVFFEDAVAVGDPAHCKAGFPHPLLKPNPTSYQLYLKQPGDRKEDATNHWGTDPGSSLPIRGYKLYWHSGDPNAWEKSPEESVLDGMQEIRPIREGTVFRGRIRFDRLSDIELGALCKVFRLGDAGQDIAWKIGQGKSIGMGSVRVTARLYLENTKEQYGRLFDERNTGWQNAMEEKSMDGYVSAFDSYCADHMPDKAGYAAALRELRALLDFGQTEQEQWSRKIAAMHPNMAGDSRLRDRVPLKDAVSVSKMRYK